MLKIDNMTVAYADGKTALEDVTCILDEGKSYALLGANGAGKSTFMKALLGLVPIKSGAAQIDEINVEPKNLSNIRKVAGLVFQNSDDQLFSASVEDDIAFGPANIGIAGDELKNLTELYLKKFDIAHLRKRSPQRLSEGEKKRVSLCAVLAMNPKVLMLDEPTAQLDARGKREITDILAALPQTLIMAAHDLDAVRKVCTHALILNAGRLAFCGHLCEALDNRELLQNCGLI